MAATEEVKTKDWSCGPACLKADVRMLRLPFMAGTTVSDHSLRSKDTGEAVCRIMWTPGAHTYGFVRYEMRELAQSLSRRRREKTWTFFHLEEVYHSQEIK